MKERTDPTVSFFEKERQPIRTAVDIVVDVVRKAIERGILAPGEKINEETLAQQLEVSRMPIRQALRMLEAEGLVQHIAHSGAVVTELSPQEMEELYHIRAALEGLAIRRAVTRYTDLDFQALSSCLHEMETCGDAIDQYVELNNLFHHLLYSPSGWNRLLNLIDQLRRNVNRYVRTSVSEPGRFERSYREHRELLAAVKARDALAAENLLHKHLFNVADVLVHKLRSAESDSLECTGSAAVEK